MLWTLVLVQYTAAMKERPLSAMVYRDAMFPDTSTESAFLGLEYLQQFVPDVAIKYETRTVRPAMWNPNFLNVDSLSWSRLPADLNIVVTERHLVQDCQVKSDGSLKRRAKNHEEILGYAFGLDNLSSNKVAIVDTTRIQKPEFVVAHEIGHLIGAKNDEDALHCLDEACLMFKTFSGEDAEKPFCEDCSDDLISKAALFKERKLGRLAIAKRKLTKTR